MTQIQIENRILGIGGSPRKGGNTDIILKTILEGASEGGSETKAVILRDYMYQSCIGCEKCRKDEICTGLNDGMTLLYPEIESSKGLVVVSPTYNYNVTSWIKSFIDRMYCFYRFNNERPRGWSSRLSGQRRKAVVAVICEQENREDMGFAIEAISKPLAAMGYDVIAELPVFSVFDKAKVKEHSDIMESARDLGKQLAELL